MRCDWRLQAFVEFEAGVVAFVDLADFIALSFLVVVDEVLLKTLLALVVARCVDHELFLALSISKGHCRLVSADLVVFLVGTERFELGGVCVIFDEVFEVVVLWGLREDWLYKLVLHGRCGNAMEVR